MARISLRESTEPVACSPSVPLPTYAFQHEYFWPGGPQRLRPLAEAGPGNWLYRTSWVGVPTVAPVAFGGESWLVVTGPAGSTAATGVARAAEAAGIAIPATDGFIVDAVVRHPGLLRR